jgi:hypothetical protein
MEATSLLTWATMGFAVLVILGLGLPYILKPLAEHRAEGHRQRMAEYEAAERAAAASAARTEAASGE